MYREHEYYLKRCIEVSKTSREHGNTPFGAILVDEDGNILRTGKCRDFHSQEHRTR